MKKSIRLFILILVFLVLLGIVFGLQRNNEDESNTVTDTQITVLDVKKEDVIRITYEYEGETYTFEKEEGTWYYAPDHSLDVTQLFINSMAGILAPLRAEQSIENVSDMAQFGLAEDVRTVQFETADASYSIEIGAYNSLSDVYYIRKPSENTVYVVSSITVAAFDKSLEDVVKTTTEETAE